MDLFSDDMRRDPYPMYDRMRRDAPVFEIPGADAWMIFDYDGVKRALHDTDAFSSNVSPSRGVRFEWLLFMDPPRHTQLRAIIMRAFTPRTIADLEPRIRELARELLEPALARGEMDVCADFAVPLPMKVMAEMLGVGSDTWLRLKRWSDAIVNLGVTVMGSGDGARAAGAEFARANAEMHDFLCSPGGMLSQRRAAPRDDLLTRLCTAEVDGQGLTDEEILRFFQLLLAAGTETTTNLIDNAVLCLTEHPGELSRLLAAPALLPTAIEEVLRYRSPAQAMLRATRRDVDIGGRVIPGGKLVLAMIGAANRDPRQFADAERFDVTRDPNPHIAFGHGIHFCLGAALSRLEGRVALGELLSQVRTIARADDQPWPPRQAFHVHGPTRLPIRFALR